MSTKSSATVPAEHLCPFKSCCFLCVCGFVLLLVQPHQPLLSEHLHPHTYSMKCSYIHYYLPHLPVCIILRPTNQPTNLLAVHPLLPAFLPTYAKSQVDRALFIKLLLPLLILLTHLCRLVVLVLVTNGNLRWRVQLERKREGPKAHTGKFTIS